MASDKLDNVAVAPFKSRYSNNLAKPLNTGVKRLIDIVIGVLVVLVTWPLVVLLCLAIKLESPGPIFFPHKRVGRYGREFDCWKFRTMLTNAEGIINELRRKNPELDAEWQRNQKLKNDPRVTRMGRLLRRTSLDELPQIYNVLKGEMSLVGPRPVVYEELVRYGGHSSAYSIVRPGLTGLWQVSGRNDIDYDERVQLDLWYVYNWSLWLDFKLLLWTIPMVLFRRGAY